MLDPERQDRFRTSRPPNQERTKTYRGKTRGKALRKGANTLSKDGFLGEEEECAFRGHTLARTKRLICAAVRLWELKRGLW